MKVGVTIPNNWGVDDPAKVIALGRLAEELGYDSVWTMDHLFNIGFIRARLDDKPYYHPLATLTYLAAVTTRLTLGTSVLVLPYHNPVELAKYAATLDRLCGGRLIMGVGAGAMPEEFAALGVPLNRRGALTNESLRIMKELWTKHAPEYHSPRWDFSDLRFEPKPRQQPHVPIWVGGASEGAMRRAATLGDGWHPNGVVPEDYGRLAGQVRDMASAAGRDASALQMSVRLNLSPELSPSGDDPRSRLSDPRRLVDTLRAYADAGVEHVCLAIEGGDTDKLAAKMRQFASEVVPAVR